MGSSQDSPVSRPSSGVVSPSTTRMPSRSRAQSTSSDRPSTVAYSLMSSPLTVSPEAAFIASSAASQIVSNDHDSHADAWFDQHGIEPSGEPAMVSPGALQLVNNFLDQLLFNFLCISRSTSLSALRPAVSEVLKPKLAKDAINQADEELREYLGGDDEDSVQAQESGSPRDWDIELVWKRTRLRCMVYSSLGDMEEEDEDYHMEKEHLEPDLEDHLSQVVSPAVAIFLTSILEFMGEAALVIAGQAAFNRMRTKYQKELKDGARIPADVADRIVIGELDMERVALDRTLGRLWRAWKKKIRSPVAPSFPGMDNSLNRSYSRDSMRSAFAHLRSPSTAMESVVPATVPEPDVDAEMEMGADGQDNNEMTQEVDEYLVPASIPLPLGPNDVEEIEVPGLVSYDDEIEVAAEQKTLASRPKSMMFLGTRIPFNPVMYQPQTPVFVTRKRSNSLPIPAAVPFDSPAKRQRVDEKDDVEGEGEETPTNAGSDVLTQTDSDAAEKAKSTSVVSPAADVEDHEEDEEEVDFVIEEPLILTSSRVSISGRSSSPSASDYGRPTDIITTLPARPPSVHSARLIDVAGPRSPATISRGSPVDPTEMVRGNLSRSSSLRAAQIMDERARRSPDITSAPRQSGTNLSKSAFLGAIVPVAESKEADDAENEVSPLTPVSSSLPSIPEPASAIDVEDRESESEFQPQAPIFGSVNRHGLSRPSSPPKPTTKVTIISSTTSSGTFLDTNDEPSPPRRSPAPSQTRASPPRSSLTSTPPPPPTVPERSPSRQASASTPTTIGQVYVEHTRDRSSPEPYISASQERPSPLAMRQHTSGSSSTTSSYKIKPVRTSEDGSFARGDVARNFEELIQSDQTIQYTLTPESMRDIDTQSISTRSLATGSPVLPAKIRASGDRSRASSLVKPAEVKRSGSISRNTGGLSSHPTNDASSRPPAVRAASSNMSSNSRASAPQARDARMPRESLADFAEFIRSTGPTGGSAQVPRNAPRNATKSSIDSGRPSTTTSGIANRSRPRLQAREASTDHRDDNSDLIDFIRRGPPSTGGNPRIPRTVAPFRSTMDSDQMSGAVGGKAVDAVVDLRSSQASTNITDYSSVQSSINSTSALLPATSNRNKPLPGNGRSYGGADTASPTNNNTFDDDMPMPKRKTRRVRDPYAIDLSDEDEMDEEDYLAALAPGPRKPQPKPVREEESLMDFLRNVPPPPPEPTPEVKAFVEARAVPKKKGSAQGLMARFTWSRGDKERTGSKGSIGGGPGSPLFGGGSGNDAQRPAASVRTNTNMSASTNGSRGYTPIQVNVPPGGSEKFGMGVSGGGSRPPVSMMNGMGMSANGVPSSGRPRVPMKKFEPREAVSVPSRATSDLADFFKNSGPPGGGGVFAGAGSGPVGGGGGSEDVRGSMWRRKKAFA